MGCTNHGVPRGKVVGHRAIVPLGSVQPDLGDGAVTERETWDGCKAARVNHALNRAFGVSGKNLNAYRKVHIHGSFEVLGTTVAS